MLAKVLNRRKFINLVSAFKMQNRREWVAMLATFFSMFNKVISLLSVFFYVRWTLPYLGKEMFGVWMTMTTIITFISIFSDLGLGSSLVNHIAASKAKNAHRDLKELTSSSFFFLSLMSLVIGILFYLLDAGILAAITNGLSSVEDVIEVRHSLLCLFAIFLISLPFVTVDKTLEGLQLTYISSIWATAGNILSLVATYLVTSHSMGILWLIMSTIGVQSAFRIIYFFLEFNGRLIINKPSLKNIRIQKATSLLQSGLMFFVLNVFNVLAFQVDNIIISKELGVGNVTLFSLMQKLMTISLFFWFYTISLWPAFAEAHSKRDLKWIKKTVSFIFKLNMSLGAAFGLFLIFFSGPILSFWANGNLAAPSFTLTLGFVLYILLNGMIGTVAIVFNTGPLLKKHVTGFCIASVCTIILKLMFVKKLGVDYLMYLPLLPFFIFYLIPCYLKYRNYVKA